MGRATISGGGEDGRYTIALDFGKATRDARVAKFDERIAVLNVEIAEAEAGVAAAVAANAAAVAALSAAINAMADALEDGGPEAAALASVEVDRAAAVAATAASAELAAKTPRDQRIFERTSLVDRKSALLAAKVEETRQVWCADFTEDATGEVATVEIPGEDQSVLIAPGGRPPENSDGRLVAREIMTPEQVFWNAAVLPGWQKWKPTYRKATITAINVEADQANVNLDPATSSANRLGVNQTNSLTAVPVVYMACNAAIFEVGDRVLVEFVGMEWGSPRIVGFVESPRPCTWVAIGSAALPGYAGTLLLQSYQPGIISRIDAETGVSISCWLDGSPVSVSRSVPSSQTFFHNVEWEPGKTRTRFAFFVTPVPPLPTGYKATSADGYLSIVLTSQESTEDEDLESLRWSTARLLIAVDGETKLDVTVAEVRPGFTPLVCRVSGVGLKQWEDSQIDVLRPG